MELNEKQTILAQKFLTESLSESEAILFKKEFESNQEFAEHVIEFGYITASIEAFAENKKTGNKIFTIGQLSKYITIAASIALFVYLGYTNYQLKNQAPQIVHITKTDTLYYRQTDEIPYPEKVAPIQYAYNAKMDELVEDKNIQYRGRNSENSLPKNNADFNVSDKINFELTNYKAGKFRFHILAFYKYVAAVDTIYSQKVTISKEDKTIYRWKPEISGIYYWEVYSGEEINPIIVKRLNVE